MDFRLLGPVEIRDNQGRVVSLPRQLARALLASLLLEVNTQVTTPDLIKCLWGDKDDHPRDGVRGYMKLLRQTFREAFGNADSLPVIRGACMIELDPQQVDHQRFLGHLKTARNAGESERVVDAARAALGEWRGQQALQNLDDQLWVATQREELKLLRLEAWQLLIKSELQLGQHKQVLEEIGKPLRLWPEDETLVSDHMLALYRSGLRIDALRAYSKFCNHLSTEIDAVPGRSLDELHERIRNNDQTLLTYDRSASIRGRGQSAPVTDDDHVVVNQEIAVHLFAHADSPEADAAWRSVQSVWVRCHSAGMTVPVTELGIPATLPPKRPSRSGVVAVCQTPDERWQAAIRLLHNVFVVSLLAKGPDGSWTAFEPELSALVGEPPIPGVFASAWLYLGAVADPLTATWAPSAVPGAGTVEGARVALNSEVQAWQLGGGSSARQLLVLGQIGHEKELGRWTWSDETPTMPKLAQYLMHMAKLRYQMRVFDSFEGLNALCDRAESVMNRLTTADSPDPVALRALTSVTMRLTRLVSQLRKMQHTVEIATYNAMQAMGRRSTAEPAKSPDWVADEHAMAQAFLVRLGDGLRYLENNLASANEFDRLLRA